MSPCGKTSSNNFVRPPCLASDRAQIFGQLPIGIQIQVRDPVELTKFLVAGRNMVESAAPGMLNWELRHHRGELYAKLSVGRMFGYERRSGAKPSDQSDQVPALYYAPTSDSLIIALRESVMQHALERRIARNAAGNNAPVAKRDWLHGNIALHADAQLFRVLSDVAENDWQTLMQGQAWDNLPILNEWKRRYPQEDPVAVHERLWGVRLVCPGGGDYQWNEKLQTMESTLYGRPDAPKRGPELPPFFKRLSGADAALTFEPNGLRVQVTLQLANGDTGGVQNAGSQSDGQ